MNKLGTAIGGLLLIGALTAPVAFAHIDSGAAPLTGALFETPVPSEPWNRGLADNFDRVSGWYYTSTGTDLDVIGNDVQNPLDDVVCDPDNEDTPVDENAICELLTGDVDESSLDGPSYFGLYDVEVGGLGECSKSTDNPAKADEDEAIEDALTLTAVANEQIVDGRPGLGLVLDGIHNDGGNSAVGHTFGHYACNGDADDTGNWETAGCDDYNRAFASDLVSGGDVWVAAVCSWAVPVIGGAQAPLADRISQFVNDLTNCPLGGFPDSCGQAIQYFDNCIGLVVITDVIPNTLLPDPAVLCGPGQTKTLVCGAGDEQTTDFGYGGGVQAAGGIVDATLPDLTAEAVYPNAGDVDNVLPTCNGVAAAYAVVLTQVVVTLTGTPDVNVIPATVGWVS